MSQRRKVVKAWPGGQFKTLGLLGYQRQQARQREIGDGHAGSLTVIQRFGGGLNLNHHVHTLVLDGTFTDFIRPRHQATRMSPECSPPFAPASAGSSRATAWRAKTRE